MIHKSKCLSITLNIIKLEILMRTRIHKDSGSKIKVQSLRLTKDGLNHILIQKIKEPTMKPGFLLQTKKSPRNLTNQCKNLKKLYLNFHGQNLWRKKVSLLQISLYLTLFASHLMAVRQVSMFLIMMILETTRALRTSF